MMNFFYKKRRAIAIFLLILITAQLAPSTVALALTSGPSQPEVQSFQPAGTSDMVDLFSGDFSYNIPLFELPGPNGGYPFNLAYQSGISMDQEASWVGLGWNLQPGAINRQMRGLPDEFNGTDQVRTKMSIDPNVTVGVGAGVGVEIFGADGLSLGLGFSVYQNNYKGMGYSIDGSLGFGKSSSSGKTVGLGFSVDSKEGVNLSPSLSLGGKGVNFGLGLGYNSKQGLQNVSVQASVDARWTAKPKSGQDKGKERRFKGSEGASLSLAHPGYTPQITMPMRNTNISITFRAGAAFWGIFGSAYLTGFYNEQWLANDKQWISSPAFGYLNYQKAANASNALLDMNREKDGLVTREVPNMAIPSLTYDIYSVNGQGISAMYRPMRNDYGVLRDQEISSESTGGSAGVDLGAVLVHAGLNLSLNHSISTSGPWNNSMSSKAAFLDSEIGNRFEPWYFKAHGEPSAEDTKSLDALGGERAMRVKLDGDNNNAVATTQLQPNHIEPAIEIQSVDGKNQQRKPRNQAIQPYTNEQILNGTEEALPHFKIEYLNQSGSKIKFDRSALPPQHIAAFTALTPEGLRYNYGIPAYNLKQEEVTYSANKKTADIDRVSLCDEPGKPCADDEPYFAYNGTDKYLRHVETPKYAHAHLLTSILGPDYVDVENDGVTPDDLGYWVKFTYKKTTTDLERFKWRDPFSRAHLQEGWKSDPRDDKGSFTYGEKELWYLSSAETKSHIATFTISKREDGKGVLTKLQDASGTGTTNGNSVYRLDEIRLFTRFGGSTAPIKVTRFEYDYSLCKNAFNSTSVGKGKLTLKRVWFEYGGSVRGKLNPYVFTYELSNPSYGMLAYDRWGNYKPNDFLTNSNLPNNSDFPYVTQDPTKKADIDKYATSWSMTEIQLPSGGKVMVDYESDDYGYVQHKPAMQMVELVDATLSDPFSGSEPPDPDNPNPKLKVRFKLERPINGSAGPSQQKSEALKYLDQNRKQVYFKMLMALRKPSESRYYEYISGYADIDLFNIATRNDLVGLEKVGGVGDFVYGFFHLKAEDNRHPFSLRAWQHLRTNQPELANIPYDDSPPPKATQTNDTNDRIKQITGMGSILNNLDQFFKGFYNSCSSEGWGRQITVGKSWIRLNSPDKIKYGGGLRVKQITMKDNWEHDEEGIYGQVYDYTTQEGTNTISSGVASYEPFVGGDENPLRYAKRYTQSVPLRADNNLFFEYPINESYYPGPQVGYSKVSVMSLASASLAGKTVSQSIFPSGTGVSYGTSGKTVHEFYTAKDFPVITDETEKVNKPYTLSAPIPFIGTVSISKLTASQGYSIVTNDMHGKQKKVSNYRQDKFGNLEPEPISWVKYNYASAQRVYEQEKIFTLANKFVKDVDDNQLLSLAKADDLTNPLTTKFTLGQENEFFMDMRQFEDNSYTGGVRINVDVLFFFFFTIPAFVPWPSVGQSETQLRTAVTNKVIFKSGILESVEAFDGGSLVKTKNEKWDKRTGSVILTTVNNNFDAPIYSYNIPAYTKYQGMGAAYQNSGVTFTATNVQAVPNQTNQYQFTVKEQAPAGLLPAGSLYPGDEMLLYNGTGSMVTPLARVVYVGEENASNRWYSEQALTATKYQALIVRSGYRNQLSVSAGSITALEDPSKKGMTATFSKTIQIPK